MNKTIKELTDTELKALVYDNLALIEQAQVNITAINTELKARAEVKPVPEIVEPKKK